MYKRSGSQFFKNTTVIQSGPDAFDNPHLVMTFLTTLGVRETSCSFRLVPDVRLRHLKKVFSKQFYFIRCRRQPLRATEWRVDSRFTFVENTIINSPEVTRVKFLGSDRSFCFNSINKFGSFKNLFATISSLSELYFRFTKFILSIQVIWIRFFLNLKTKT